MTNGRHLWATLQLGSHLYGTTVEGSDTDLLELYLPTPVELVDNKRLHLPQCIKDGIDTRGALLGDFVMSLGINVEHSTLAYHYSDLFGDLQTYWLNGHALRAILDAATNMWVNAESPKNKAHAYRYALAASRMSRGEKLYPLEGQALIDYMLLRHGAEDTSWGFMNSMNALRQYTEGLWKSKPAPTDRQKRAEWVMLRYLGLANE